MKKVWTVSRGLILATPLDVEKAQSINALLSRPANILPTTPGDPIKPFAIGLFDEMRTNLRSGIGSTTLRRAVAAFVHSKRYYFASAQPDSMRHDIEGRPTEPLSDADRLVAQNRFQSLKRNITEILAPETMIAPAQSKAELIRAGLLATRRPERQPAG